MFLWRDYQAYELLKKLNVWIRDTKVALKTYFYLAVAFDYEVTINVDAH